MASAEGEKRWLLTYKFEPFVKEPEWLPSTVIVMKVHDGNSSIHDLLVS